jgi:hypothetical protein
MRARVRYLKGEEELRLRSRARSLVGNPSPLPATAAGFSFVGVEQPPGTCNSGAGPFHVGLGTIGSSLSF